MLARLQWRTVEAVRRRPSRVGPPYALPGRHVITRSGDAPARAKFNKARVVDDGFVGHCERVSLSRADFEESLFFFFCSIFSPFSEV